MTAIANPPNLKKRLLEELNNVDTQIMELSEMLPFASPLTRRTFLQKIDHLLDMRLELMKDPL
jgi:hypothetical protein